MTLWIAFWNILAKDLRANYLKAPNIRWGLVFPMVWTAMLLIRSENELGGLERIPALLPGLVAVSILFGTTSMVALAVNEEKQNRTFERLMLAPVPMGLLVLAKTSGAILFGIAGAFMPVAIVAVLADLSQVSWWAFIPAVFLIAVTSTLVGLFMAVTASAVFKAPIFANIYRIPMVLLCGLFFPIGKLPLILQPLSYVLPLTYGADMLHGAVHGGHALPLCLNLSVLIFFCAVLFGISLHTIKRSRIA